MINQVGHLKYGYNNFQANDIKCIERAFIQVPLGDTLDEKTALKAADMLSDIVGNPDKKEDIQYYSMLCDAAHRDYPNSPAKFVKDENGIPIMATHITGLYGKKYAVVPDVLASYEQVIQNIAKSFNSSERIDITG